MAYLLERDTINGKEGRAFVTLHGKNQELFSLKYIKATIGIQNEDMTVVGTSVIQSKSTGVKNTGTATIYYGTPLFTQMAVEYASTGVLPYFDIQIINNDPTSTVGEQIVGLYGCKLSGDIIISRLDSETSMLTQDISFTFTRAATLQSFNDPAQLGS